MKVMQFGLVVRPSTLLRNQTTSGDWLSQFLKDKTMTDTGKFFSCPKSTVVSITSVVVPQNLGRDAKLQISELVKSPTWIHNVRDTHKLNKGLFRFVLVWHSGTKLSEDCWCRPSMVKLVLGIAKENAFIPRNKSSKLIFSCRYRDNARDFLASRRNASVLQSVSFSLGLLAFFCLSPRATLQILS